MTTLKQTQKGSEADGGRFRQNRLCLGRKLIKKLGILKP